MGGLCRLWGIFYGGDGLNISPILIIECVTFGKVTITIDMEYWLNQPDIVDIMAIENKCTYTGIGPTWAGY
jgi:hypothetical protein